MTVTPLEGCNQGAIESYQSFLKEKGGWRGGGGDESVSPTITRIAARGIRRGALVDL